MSYNGFEHLQKVYETEDLVRMLVPKSFHFDGYNEVNCPNVSKRAFFGENIFKIGNHQLITHLEDRNTLSIYFSSVCEEKRIVFESFRLSLNDYIIKLKNALKTDTDFIIFKIPVSYDDLNCYHCQYYCNHKTMACENLNSGTLSYVLAGVSFNMDDIRKALSGESCSINTTATKKGGLPTMKKFNSNPFGLNIELGISKDPNIASTLMGVAVRNPESGSWYIFDAKNNTRKNLGKMKMGNFPIMLIPTKTLSVGALTKMDGKYYYVKSINPSGTLTLISAADGVVLEKISEENLIPGMTLFTTVVAFDANTLTNVSSKENISRNVLAAICMMQWNKGDGAEFSLDNINDESFNGLGSLVPILMATGGLGGMLGGNDGSMNLPMLLALGQGSGNEDNATQLMILSQLLDGNTPVSSIFGAVSPNASSDAKVVCEQCSITYPDGTNFCPKCGSKTKKVAGVCRKCGATLMDGAMFCHICGAKATQNICPKCGRTLEGTENFCAGCGTNLKAPVAPKTCPKCNRTIQEDEKFCAGCGTNLLTWITPVPAVAPAPVAPATPSAETATEVTPSSEG